MPESRRTDFFSWVASFLWTLWCTKRIMAARRREAVCECHRPGDWQTNNLSCSLLGHVESEMPLRERWSGKRVPWQTRASPVTSRVATVRKERERRAVHLCQGVLRKASARTNVQPSGKATRCARRARVSSLRREQIAPPVVRK